MESGVITDQQIRAFTQWDANHAASQGRLHYQQNGAKHGGWSSLTNDVDQWFQVDAGNRHTITTRVATQGRNSSQFDQWVTSYNLQYSDDELNFNYYKEQEQIKVKCIYFNPQKCLQTSQGTHAFYRLINPIQSGRLWSF